MSMTSISIITVVKNGMPHLGACIDSVKRQIQSPREHIIIDGGSTDGTRELLASLDNINSTTEKDRGISHAFNKGWKKASAEFVCHLNSDDWLESNHISNVQSIIDNDNPDIIISTMFFDSPQKSRILKPKFPKLPYPKIWFYPQINHPGMVIRKSLLQSVGGYDENYKLAMDADFFYKALKLKPKIYCSDQITVHQRSGGMSQINWEHAIKEMYEIELKHGRFHFTSLLAYYWRITKSRIKNLILGLI